MSTDALTTLNPAAAPPAPRELLSPEREARLFWGLRWRMLRAVVGQTLRQGRLRLAVLCIFSAVFWAALFILFVEGFQLVQANLGHAGTRAQTVQAIFNVFFLSLSVMLAFSAAIIMYGNLYRSEEVSFLLSLPVSCHRIVIYKFQETAVFATWGVILLGSPMLVAYGLVCGAPWYYFALILPFLIAFVLIPTNLGALACLVVVRFLPAARKYAVVAGGMLLLVGLIFAGRWIVGELQLDNLKAAWFQQMLERMQFTQQRLLPSWWLSSGLLEAAHPSAGRDRLPSWQESLLFFSVLATNALLLETLVGFVGDRLLRTSYSRLPGLASSRKKITPATMDRVLSAVLRPLPPAMRLLIVNDVRICRRDPMQWSQLVIFFGLMALYFMNVRRFQYGEPLVQWVTMVGYLNLGVVTLLLSTFTTRFIFPLISLEGRRFWILGTLPIPRSSILWSKFLFAWIGSWPACALVVFLSDILLGIVANTPLVAGIHQFACALLCVSLSGLAVGLGARFPNMRESSPSKIAAGFGGTLNLVLSAGLIMAVVFSLAAPSYFWVEQNVSSTATFSAGLVPPWLGWLGLGTYWGLGMGLAISTLCCVAATAIPLVLGFRAFQRMEF